MLPAPMPDDEMNTTQTTHVALNATVRGHVQGVFFRAFVASAAERLGVGGYVYNQPDGSVYVAVRGERATLEELLKLLWQGPERANVTNVEYEWTLGETEIEAHSFRVRD